MLSDLIRQRQSVRKYSTKPVEREKLQLCLEAARLAPSASNSQPWRFIVIDKPELVSEVARATITTGIPINKFAMEAPVLVVFVLVKPKPVTRLAGWIRNKEFEWTDMGIAAEHFCLQATESGLGTCMIGWFNEKKIKSLLGIPARLRVGLVVTLGYAPENYLLRKKIRKPTKEVIFYNQWQPPRI